MIRFGILGAGNIARRFAASLAHEQDAQLVAVSCRTQEKADAAAAELGAAHAHGSHEALLQDPEVDAIYLSLPHDLHFDWALRALRAHKAVLCEKPAMLTAEQMSEVARIAREEGVLFMEAMKSRFVPLYSHLDELLEQIGHLVYVEASLCNDMLAHVEGSGSYHMTPGPGSGVLLDCGIYCASWLEAYGKGTPRLLSCTGAARSGIDTYADAHIVFDNIKTRLECAFDRRKPRKARFVGNKGFLVVEEVHRPTSATLCVIGHRPQEIDIPCKHDDFFGEIHHFVGLLEEGKTESPVMPLESSIRCAQILDVIRPTFATFQHLDE